MKLTKAQKFKFTFSVGIFEGRKITVISDDVKNAEHKAKIGLDEIYEKEEREPPVSWTLILTNVEPYENET